MASLKKASGRRTDQTKTHREVFMRQNQDLKCIDKLIADLGGSNDTGRRGPGPCDLLLEHLQAARRYLLGSMPGEYSLSLQQAEESLACMPDKDVRNRVRMVLRTAIASEVARAPHMLAPSKTNSLRTVRERFVNMPQQI
jgi:hypothetical protein